MATPNTEMDRRNPVKVEKFIFYLLLGLFFGPRNFPGLWLEEVGDQVVKALEVSKIRGAEKSTGNVISFDVEPNLGMRIVPITRAKA